MKKLISAFIKHSFAFVLFIILAFSLSYLFYLWGGSPAGRPGFPGGPDAIQHVYRLNVVAQFFPHHTWLHTWAGGMPHFIIYPTLPYLPMAILMKLTGWTSYFSLFFSGVFSFGLLAFAIYLVVYNLTHNWLVSVLSGVLILANQGTWHTLLNGVFARVIAAPFMVFVWVAFINYWKRYVAGKDVRAWFVLTSFILGLTFTLHFFMGVLALFVIGVMAILTGNKFLDSTAEVIKLSLFAFLLAGSTLLPIIFLRPPGIWVGQDVSQQLHSVTPLRFYFYWHNPNSIYPKNYVLAYYFLPLTLVSSIIFIFLKAKGLLKRYYQGIVTSMALLTISFFVYNQFPVHFLGFFYNQFLPFQWVLSYLPLFLAIFISCAIWSLLRHQKAILVIITVVFLCGLGLGLYEQYDPYVPQTEDSRFVRFLITGEKDQAEKFKERVIEDEKDFNFRFGSGNYGITSVWFNVLFPFIPQTRDFFFPGIVEPDSYFELIKTAWIEKDNYPDTNFFFDWWGVKQFIAKAGRIENISGKFSERSEHYDFVTETSALREGTFQVFEYRNATPILAANNSPAVLVIGRQPEAQTTVFRSLIYGDFNSRFAIPLEGKEFIDDHTLAELKQFPVVFLYQSYKWHNFEKVQNLLHDYVSDGGRLIIEANRDLEVTSRLPEVYPVRKVNKVEIEKWELTGNIEGLDFSAFDKAVYDDGAWGAMVAEQLSENSEVLISQTGEPILVKKEFDRGVVIWSGMNLPFHTTYYHNLEESRLMAKILGVERESEEVRTKETSVSNVSNNKGGIIYESSQETVEFVHPEKRVVKLKAPASGVLFKEANFPNWKVKVNGKRSKIYKAGPGFMYVSLPDSKAEDEIVFVFGTHFIQWLGRAISIGTLLGLVFYFFRWRIFEGRLKKVKIKLLFPMKNLRRWWEREE